MQSLMPMLQASPSDRLTLSATLGEMQYEILVLGIYQNFVTAKCFPDAKFILLASKDVYCMLLRQRFVLQLVAK